MFNSNNNNNENCLSFLASFNDNADLTTTTTTIDSTTNNTQKQHQTTTTLMCNSRVGGTPKRRLSYNNTPNSTNTIHNPNTTSTMNNFSNNNNNNNNITISTTGSSNGTPYIKRKCLQENTNIANTWRNHSPYYGTTTNTLSIYPQQQHQQQQQQQHYSTSPFNNDCITQVNYSPRHLNESFETLQINNENLKPSLNNQECEFKLQKKLTHSKSIPSRRSVLMSRFKSAPIQMLDFDRMEHQPLGDISNTTTTSTTTTSTTTTTNKINLNNNLTNNELEDFFFSSSTTATTTIESNLDEKQIKESLEADVNGQNLIGDRSRNHLLPFKRSIKHQDLFCITPETLVSLLDGVYDDDIEKVIIIDSRYPYEYDGGHIATAQNIFTKEKLLEELFVHKIGNNNENIIDSAYKTTNKRVIIIFHCEFSSERGPSLLRFLRNQDRQMNEHSYPKLFYPELYLLEGGYKSFYEHYKMYCQPQEYKPMLHEMHLKEMRHFRSKAKSWEIQKQHLSASNIRLSASSLAIKHLTQKTFSLATNMSICSSTSSSTSTLTSSSTMVKFE